METTMINNTNYVPTLNSEATDKLYADNNLELKNSFTEKDEEIPATSVVKEKPVKVIMDEADVKNFLYMMVGLDVKVEANSDYAGINFNSIA